jgi:choice-of-anchor A domain-containing protein
MFFGVIPVYAARSLIASSIVLFATCSVNAAPMTAQELLNAYNVIVLGNATNNSHVDGKGYIGGNLTSDQNKTGEYNSHNVSAGAGLPSLTVGKNLSGSFNINGPGVAIGGNLATGGYNANGGGNAYIGGNWTGSANFNLNGTGNVYLGGTKTGSGNVNGGLLNENQNSPSFLANIPTTATTTQIQNTLTSYSASLDALTANSIVNVASGTATFTAAPNATGLAVFDIANALAFFNSVNQIAFNLNGAKELIINITGAGSNPINIAANFLAGSAQARALDTVWNFIDATNITIKNQFGGSILALLADVTLDQNEEGTLVSKGLIQNAEIHYVGANNNLPNPPQEVPGQTPIPGALPLFATGLGALALIARRRKQKTVA